MTALARTTNVLPLPSMGTALAAALVASLTSACHQPVDLACNFESTKLKVAFVGAIDGTGELRLDGRGGRMNAQLTLFNPPEDVNLMQLDWSNDDGVNIVAEQRGQTEKFLELRGRGMCALGDIRVDFDSARSTNGKYRIGSSMLVGMLQPPRKELAVGFYEAVITDVKAQRGRRVTGYWRNLPEPSPREPGEHELDTADASGDPSAPPDASSAVAKASDPSPHGSPE